MTDSLSREEFLRRSFAVGALMTVPGLAAEVARAGVDIPPGVDPKRLKKTMVFSNWPLYIDYDKKHHRYPTLDMFTKQYGVKVKYLEDINQNETFFGKIQAQLRRGQSIGRDLIVMTDNSRFPALMVQQKLVWRRSTRASFQTSRTCCRRSPDPGLGPAPRAQPALAVGHDRHRLQRQVHEAGDRPSTSSSSTGS